MERVDEADVREINLLLTLLYHLFTQRDHGGPPRPPAGPARIQTTGAGRRRPLRRARGSCSWAAAPALHGWGHGPAPRRAPRARSAVGSLQLTDGRRGACKSGAGSGLAVSVLRKGTTIREAKRPCKTPRRVPDLAEASIWHDIEGALFFSECTAGTLCASQTMRYCEEACRSDLVSDPRVITEAAPPYRIVHVNKAWCETTGYMQSALIGSTCKILQGPETCRRTMQASAADEKGCPRRDSTVSVGAPPPCTFARAAPPARRCPPV